MRKLEKQLKEFNMITMRSRKSYLSLKKMIDYIELNNFIMAEIGCYRGESTSFFASFDKIKFIYAIDQWCSGYDLNDIASRSDMTLVEECFDFNMLPYVNKFQKIKESSQNAHLLFKDYSLDFVYIDASHLYEDVKNDITNWFPKINKNGYIGGHDYESNKKNNFSWGVTQAINDTLGVPDFTFKDSSWIFKSKDIEF